MDQMERVKQIDLLIIISYSIVANPNITLPSSYQVLKDGAITLHFDFDNSSANATVTLAVVMSQPPFGWIGIGFGNTVMTNTDMFIAQLTNGQISIDDYYSTKQGRPSLDKNLPGGKSDWEFVDYNLNESMWVVKVKRLVNTGDSYDHVLNQNENLPLCVAWGNKTLSNHKSNYLQLNINFTLGAGGKGVQTISPKDVHTWLLLASWGILVDIGLIAARYMKGSKSYLIVHSIFAGGAVAATLGAVIQMFVFSNQFFLNL